MNNITTAELYTKITGKPWETAKKEGLTDGSFSANMKLRKKLLSETEIKTETKAEQPMERVNSTSSQTFNQAFAQARETLGDNKVFTYNGKQYSTNVASKPSAPKSVASNIKIVKPAFDVPAVNKTDIKVVPNIVTAMQKNKSFIKPDIKSTTATRTVSKEPQFPADVEETLAEKRKNANFKSFKGKYYILSKEDGNLYVFNNNHDLISKTGALRGAALGDFPNAADVNTTIPGPGATTPAGSAVIRSSNRFVDKDYGTPFYSFRYNHEKETPKTWENGILGIHGIYKPEYKKREAIINDPNDKNKCGSWGCINVDPKWLMFPQNKPVGGDSLFITSEPARNKYLIELRNRYLANLQKSSTNLTNNEI